MSPCGACLSKALAASFALSMNTGSRKLFEPAATSHSPLQIPHSTPHINHSTLITLQLPTSLLSFPMFAPRTTPSHQPSVTSIANSLRFSSLRTLLPDANSLLFSFQQIAHSFSSHGTRPSASPYFAFRVSNFGRSLSSFFATLTDSFSRNSFICHSYKNTGGGTHLFPLWNWATIFPSLKPRPS